MGQGTPYCTAGTNWHVTYEGHSLGQERATVAYQFRTLDISVAGECADSQTSLHFTYICELRQVVNIHQMRWLRQPHIEQGNQALTPSKDLRIIGIGIKQGKHFTACRWIMIRKAGRFHHSLLL